MNQMYVGDGLWITLVFDGQGTHLGNFLGIHFMPLNGARVKWVAANGDWAECETEQEAIREIMEAWKR